MRILGILFLASAATVFGGGIGPNIETLGSCGSVTVLSELTGSEGCALAPFSIFNAAFSAPEGEPATTAEDIAVNIGLSGDSLSLSFSGLFFYPSSTPNPPGVAEYVISYTIDPPPPVILGFEMDMEFGDFGFRFASFEGLEAAAAQQTIEISTLLCFGSTFGQECTQGTEGSLLLNDNQLTDGLRNRVGTNLVDVIHYIRISKDLNLIVNNRAPLAPVPEPGTWALMGSSLLLLAWRRRR